MGLDCKLITDEKIIDLDRYYVFDNQIEIDKNYSKDAFIEIIDSLLNRIKDIGYQDAEYNKKWLNIAKNNAGKYNKIEVLN